MAKTQIVFGEVGGGGCTAEFDSVSVSSSSFTYINVPSKPKYVYAMWTHATYGSSILEVLWNENTQNWICYRTIGTGGTIREIIATGNPLSSTAIEVSNAQVGFKQATNLGNTCYYAIVY